MPYYQYTCNNNHILEAKYLIGRAPKRRRCPKCGKWMRRLYTPVPIKFRGAGFYVNDSKKSARDKEDGEAGV